MRARTLHCAVLFVLLAGLLFFKLLELQVTDGDLWNNEALKARTRAETIAFERGKLLDREGRLLATSEATHDLLFVYGRLRATSIGQLQVLHYLLFQERPRLADVRAHPEPFIESIAAMRARSVVSLKPRERRRDVLNLLGQLARPRLKISELSQLLGAGAGRDQTVGEVLDDLRELARTRVAKDFASLDHLASLLDADDLVGELDVEVGRIDRIVRQELEAMSGPIRDVFGTERILHNDLDYRLDRVITAQVPYAVVEEVALNPDRYPEFEIREAHRRTYPAACADLAPQLVGFVGAPEPERLKKTEEDQRRLETLELKEDKTADEIDEMVALEAAVRSRDYRAFEEEGRGGLERAFENLLRGQRGYRKVERDVSGQGVKTIEEELASPGRDVRLTIDAELQLACEEVLEHATDELPGAHIESGALVIINPSGEVLAAASSPRIERARYRDELAREADALNRDRRGGPAYHRAYAPKFPPPPGSVFKPFVAIAGLEAGLLDEQTTVFCDGGIGQKPARITCLGRHENVSLATAMAKSCNAYFGHAGEVLGDVRLRAIASVFGFGERTGFATNGLDGLGLGIDLRRPGLFEADGALDPPNESLRGLRAFGCGQAPFDNVTPLQVARAMAGLATGELPELRIVLAVDDTLVPVPPPAPLPIRSDVLEIVRHTLAGVVGPEGTAKPQGDRDLRRFGLVGKSGTAQIAAKGLADDAWFAGYLPREKPSLIVVLLLEHATFGERSVHGGEAAVPLLYRLFSDPRAARFLGTRP